MASAAFTINGGSGPVTVAAGAAINLALISQTDARQIVWSLQSSDPTVADPAITDNGATASFTMPVSVGSVGYAVIVTCEVNGGVNSAGIYVDGHTFTALIGVANSGGYLPWVNSEQLERHPTHGFALELNAQLATVSGGGGVPSGTSDPNAGGGIAGDAGDLYVRQDATANYDSRVYVNMDGTATGWWAPPTGPDGSVHVYTGSVFDQTEANAQFDLYSRLGVNHIVVTATGASVTLPDGAHDGFMVTFKAGNLYQVVTINSSSDASLPTGALTQVVQGYVSGQRQTITYVKQGSVWQPLHWSGRSSAPQYTTAVRDALTPQNGDIIYNISTSQLTARIAGAWVQLGVGSPPGGSNTQFQYNNSSAFGGSAGFTWDATDTTPVMAKTALGTTTDVGHRLENSTAATGGATVQVSPALELVGHGWNGSASEQFSWQTAVVPLATTEQSKLVTSIDLDGGGFSEAYSVEIQGDPPTYYKLRAYNTHDVLECYESDGSYLKLGSTNDTLYLQSTTDVQIRPNSTLSARFYDTSIRAEVEFNAIAAVRFWDADVAFHGTVTSPTLGQLAASSGTGDEFKIYAQPISGGAASAFIGGKLTLSGGDATNSDGGGTATGGGVDVVGATGADGNGIVRLLSGATAIAQFGDATNPVQIGTSSLNGDTIFDMASISYVYQFQFAGENRLQIGGTGITHGSGVVNPNYTQTAVGDAAGRVMLFQSQSNNSTGSAAGNIIMRPGANAGSGANGKGRLEATSGLPAFEWDYAGSVTRLAFFDATLKAQPTRIGQVTNSTGGTPGSSVTAPGQDYGGLSASGNTTATTITTQNTWYQFTGFGSNMSASGATPDHTTDDITIANAGTYLIIITASFEGAGAETYQLAALKNNGASSVSSGIIQVDATAATTVSSCTIGIDTLSASDTIELWARCSTASSTSVTIRNATLIVKRLDNVLADDFATLVSGYNSLEALVSAAGGGFGLTA